MTEKTCIYRYPSYKALGDLASTVCGAEPSDEAHHREFHSRGACLTDATSCMYHAFKAAPESPVRPDIMLGGPTVYNAGQTQHVLRIARASDRSRVSAVFDISQPEPSAFIASQVDEEQAAQIIAALQWVFPALVPAPVPAPLPAPKVVDPITKFFDEADNEGYQTDAPVVLRLRVAGKEVLAINAMDSRGFDIRKRTESGSAWSRSLGYVAPVFTSGAGGEREWRAETAGLAKGTHSNPIAAIKWLLGR